ncbi:hypothetical protein [Fluviispira multicolorata]|uniref:Uncharacterized protein n=1 Tax=Fluviispira multicolorata TaxID=2654512 RepID=A0A833JCI0_9BACT|nr:hypothetical protein [Fluviispira multicolorata]KAB8029992.1 hypothetical protein GCL57_10675 [Fluviispira multicolorata]
MFNKYTAIFGIVFVLLFLFINKFFFSSEKSSEINVSQSEKNKIVSIKNSVEPSIKDNKTKERQNIAENNNVFEDQVNNSMPSGILEAEQEVKFLEKKLKDENAVERLNSNSISDSDRQNYQQIYKRLSLLSKYIMEKKYEDLSLKVTEYEREHDKNLEELGLKKEIN